VRKGDAQEGVHEVEGFLCLEVEVLDHGARKLVRVVLVELDDLLEDVDVDRLEVVSRGRVGRTRDALGGWHQAGPVWSEWTLLGRRGWSVREGGRVKLVAKEWREGGALGEGLVGAYTQCVGSV